MTTCSRPLIKIKKNLHLDGVLLAHTPAERQHSSLRVQRKRRPRRRAGVVIQREEALPSTATGASRASAGSATVVDVVECKVAPAAVEKCARVVPEKVARGRRGPVDAHGKSANRTLNRQTHWIHTRKLINTKGNGRAYNGCILKGGVEGEDADEGSGFESALGSNGGLGRRHDERESMLVLNVGTQIFEFFCDSWQTMRKMLD